MSPNHLPTLFTTLTAGVAACLAMLGVTAVADAAATRSCTRRRRGNPELPGVRGGDNVDCAEQPVGFAQFKRQSGKAPNVKRVVLGITRTCSRPPVPVRCPKGYLPTLQAGAELRRSALDSQVSGR